MKLARVFVVAVALLMLIAGCAKRNENTSSVSEPGVLPEVGSKIEEGADTLRSDIEEGMSGIGDGSSMDESSSMESEAPLNSLDEPQSSMNESAAPAMSTDFSEIGALSGAKDDGFPGGELDDKKRPSGPLSYQKKYGKYDAHFIVPDSDKVYLTFDEGYENGYTSMILDTLKEKNVKAVFFITYPYAKGEQDLVKRMVDEGHILGNHSTAHKIFPDLPLKEAADDIMNLHNYVKETYGYDMYLFRPPEGAFSEQTLALAQKLGYKTMLWSFAYKDYDVNSQPLTLEATDNIVRKAHPGELCLLHAVSKTNAEILGDVIDQIRGKGLEFSDYFFLSPNPQLPAAENENSIVNEDN